MCSAKQSEFGKKTAAAASKTAAAAPIVTKREARMAVISP
jgi:hypothetical protein